jgi:hypothetical protein
VRTSIISGSAFGGHVNWSVPGVEQSFRLNERDYFSVARCADPELRVRAWALLLDLTAQSPGGGKAGAEDVEGRSEDVRFALERGNIRK